MAGTNKDFTLSFDTALAVDSGTNFLAASDTYSTYYIPRAAKGEFNPHKPMFVECFVDTAFTSGGAATLTVSLMGDTDSAFGTEVVLAASDAIAVATLAAGYTFRLPVPPNAMNYNYFRLKYDVGVANMTAGAISAGMVDYFDTNTEV